ncbi:MAG: hypothetical protein ACPGO3_05005 [Magnetospiraceae bacterium]
MTKQKLTNRIAARSTPPGKVMGYALGLVFLGFALSACAAAGDAAPKGTGPTEQQPEISSPPRLAVGESAAAWRRAVGPPASVMALHNDSPATLGAEAWTYDIAGNRLELEAPGGSRRRVGSVILVLDPWGILLRAVENPNAAGPTSQRTLRGRPSLAAMAVTLRPENGPFDPGNR